MSIFGKKEEAPQQISVKDKALSCQHCGNDLFYVKYPSIFFSGYGMNTRVTCFICSECTHMHWFDSNN